jgi:hypothetical protein
MQNALQKNSGAHPTPTLRPQNQKVTFGGKKPVSHPTLEDGSLVKLRYGWDFKKKIGRCGKQVFYREKIIQILGVHTPHDRSLSSLSLAPLTLTLA